MAKSGPAFSASVKARLVSRFAFFSSAASSAIPLRINTKTPTLVNHRVMVYLLGLTRRAWCAQWRSRISRIKRARYVATALQGMVRRAASRSKRPNAKDCKEEDCSTDQATQERHAGGNIGESIFCRFAFDGEPAAILDLFENAEQLHPVNVAVAQRHFLGSAAGAGLASILGVT